MNFSFTLMKSTNLGFIFSYLLKVKNEDTSLLILIYTKFEIILTPVYVTSNNKFSNIFANSYSMVRTIHLKKTFLSRTCAILCFSREKVPIIYNYWIHWIYFLNLIIYKMYIHNKGNVLICHQTHRDESYIFFIISDTFTKARLGRFHLVFLIVFYLLIWFFTLSHQSFYWLGRYFVIK